MTSKVRNRRNLVAASALTAAVAAVAGVWAVTAGGAGGAASTSTAAATWTPGGQLPGALMATTLPSARVKSAVQAALAISGGIDPGSVREVVSGGAFGGFGMRLITARGIGGDPCFAMVTDSGGARSFFCLGSQAGGGALIRYVADGGTTIGNVEWVSFVGLARSDVARVTLVTQSGMEQGLTLNRWRGFTYSTDRKGAFPASLRAYDANGSLIEEMVTLP